jgi:hypothetical protein
VPKSFDLQMPMPASRAQINALRQLILDGNGQEAGRMWSKIREQFRIYNNA